MENLVKIIVSVFILFISAPTIVIVLDADVDTSYLFQMSEEEENDFDFNEFKNISVIYSILFFVDNQRVLKRQYISNNECIIDSIKPKIFLQPPI